MVGLYTYAFFSPSLDIKSPNNIQFYDKDNNIINNSLNDWTAIEDISPSLLDAVISIEDKNFYHHQGFDYLRIAKAMFENFKNKAIVQGASTISQQYIKNLYLDFDKTWKRKAEEAMLTLELEVHYSKDEILEGYLNTINYGQGNFGITSASKYYFGKEPKYLTLEESIILAGIPKNPSNYNPVSNYDECINRARIVAKAMLDNNKITKQEYNTLFQNKIEILSQNEKDISNMTMYYTDAVLEELKTIKEIPNTLISSKGLKIYTYYDKDTQDNMESSILKYLKNKDIEVASMIVDPHTGGIMALSGGKNYSKSQFNRAIQSKRQVGSTMKPFLYYAALENNFTSSTTFTSEKTTFNLANGKEYSPKNYNDSYANKNITMAAAIALSDNIYAIKTNLFLGVDKMLEIAKRCGIKEKLSDVVSSALGTNEINMKDFANGYLAFASNGYNKKAHLIRKVEDVDGNIIYEYKDDNIMILNQNYTYILNEMLTNTYNPAFKDYSTPSALSIKPKMSHKYAIKTGTTNTDYWISGYNPNVLMLVWVGYDNNKEVSQDENQYAKNIWIDSVEYFLKDKDNNWYEKPDGVIGLIKDPITGSDTNNNEKAALYYYVKGTENAVFKEEKKDS
jgi:1A family penicillin-binding protein